MAADPTDPLVQAFAASQPEELAVVVAGADLDEQAAFIRALPMARAAVVAARLPSWQLTGVMGALEPGTISRMLLEAATDDAVALVSHLRESRYPAIVDACPDTDRQRLRQLFDFPSHSLASLATTDFIRVTADTTCADFGRQLSDSRDVRPRPVFVVDSQGRYQGTLSLQAAYARRNRGRSVSDVADRLEPLQGMTSAEAALTSRLWARYTELPVVDGHHRVLGVVSRAALLRIVGEGSGGEFTPGQILAEVATGYLRTCASLLEGLLGRTP